VLDPTKLEDGLTAGLKFCQDQDSFTKRRLWSLPFNPKHASFVESSAGTGKVHI